MRKYSFVLPAAAIMLAAVVLTTELGTTFAARTPDKPAASPAKSDLYADDAVDLTASNWVETGSGLVDTRKPRLPPKGGSARR